MPILASQSVQSQLQRQVLASQIGPLSSELYLQNLFQPHSDKKRDHLQAQVRAAPALVHQLSLSNCLKAPDRLRRAA